MNTAPFVFSREIGFKDDQTTIAGEIAQALPNANDMTSTGAHGTTFHGFSKLPTEIRLKIWEMARPEPQIFHLSPKTTQPPSSQFYRLFVLDPLAQNKIPALVHACSESRELALTKWYNHSFRVQCSGHMLDVSHFFDAERDYLYLSCGECCQRVICSTCDSVPTTALKRSIKKVICHYGKLWWVTELQASGISSFEEVIILKPDHLLLEKGTKMEDLMEFEYNKPRFPKDQPPRMMRDYFNDDVQLYHEIERSASLYRLSAFEKSWVDKMTELIDCGLPLENVDRLIRECRPWEVPETVPYVENVWVSELKANQSVDSSQL